MSEVAERLLVRTMGWGVQPTDTGDSGRSELGWSLRVRALRRPNPRRRR